MKRRGNMTIRKNGRIFRLTETDLKRIVKKVLREDTDMIGDEDYDEAVMFCTEVEDWWKGSSNVFDDPERASDTTGTNYVDFFSRYQRFFDDQDDAAARAYGDMIYSHLDKKVGRKNKYYNKIKGWLEQIVDEIDDVMQDECWLNLKSTDGRAKDFVVDPEIDVDGIFGW